MSGFVVRFLTRPGCHLCDDARPLVLDAAKRTGVCVEELDVDSDDELLASYGLRIPVVLGAGDEVLAEGRIGSVRELAKAIRSASRRW